METEPPQSPSPNHHHHSDIEPKSIQPKPNHSSFSSVDTSRPFSSVKEAVAIFGERLISGELYSYPKPLFSTPRRHTSLISFSEIQPAHQDTPRNYLSGFSSAIEDAVSRIEADLEQTKAELKILKMRESETEVILASLHAELHRSMSIIARAEAVDAAHKERETIAGGGRDGMREKTATLGQILCCREEERFSLERGRGKAEKKKKKNPIVPLLLDLFSRKKKGSSSSSGSGIRSSLHSSARVHLN